MAISRKPKPDVSEAAIKAVIEKGGSVAQDKLDAGNGLAKDNNLAIMWIPKAASLGHPIAIAQIKSIRPA
jgi:hypothetical protein